jgi:hypothetical protein
LKEPDTFLCGYLLKDKIEKAAHHAQAAHGHSQKAKDHANKASEKYAEKAGSMKSEGNQKEMAGTANGRN